MPAPIAGAVVAAATRFAAKKIAQKKVKQGLAKAASRRTARIASNSVKPVKFGAANAAKFNQGSMMRTTDAATGAAARKGAARLGVTGTKGVQKPIKINTDPTKPKGVFGPLKKKIAAKSPEGRANVRANARGLKAANKPVSKKNAGQTASKIKTDIIKNATPARANRTRLGKSAFKSK
jgi:hypothetical protein